MGSTVDLWTPPEGMRSHVVTEWRAFYRRALDNYDTTPEQYQWLYKIQKGRCWICRLAKGKHPDDPRGLGGRRLGIDHNHITGQVRGLLCTGGDKTCNRIIGWLSAPALRRAADYLDGTATPGRYLDDITSSGTRWAETVLWPDKP
jgi:hypothetical protein